MKVLTLLFFVFFCVVLSAQKHDHEDFNSDPSEGNAHLFFKKYNPDIKEPIDYYKNQNTSLRQIPGEQFIPTKEVKGKAGVTYVYDQYLNGLPVLDGKVKINIPDNNKISVAVTSSAVNPNSREVNPLFQNAELYLLYDDKLIPAQKQFVYENEIGYLVLTGKDQDTILKRPVGAGSGTDTARGKIFNPNPITSANTVYGPPYVNNNDQTNPELDAELQTVKLYVTKSNDTSHLNNDYLTITEHSPPTISPAVSTNDTFFYDRSQDHFEDVNAFYHITQMGMYVDSLNYSGHFNFIPDVDANGFSGSDNSFFDPSFDPPRITFGTGGVDDAEDADVVIHEYGHAIMYALAPGTNQGTERRAMEEGLCDYFAASYSRTIDPYEHRLVFNWDGHNEFWAGREVITFDKYPDKLDNNIYDDSRFWSTAVLRVENNIGRDETHELQFESALNYVSFLSMTDAAYLFLRADSMLNNAEFYPYLSHVFLEAGFIESSDVNRPEDLVSVFERSNEQKQKVPVVLNSAGFAAGSGLLELRLIEERISEIRIFNSSGKLIRRETPNARSAVFEPDRFTGGIYIFIISSESGKNYSEKVVKIR